MPSDTLLLSSPDLLRRQAYINGQWCEAESGRRFPVFDPATGAHLADVPDMNAADVRRAVGAAHDAWRAWRATAPAERARLLRRWHDLIRERVEDLALLMTSEQGKPLAESRAEVIHGAAFVEWFAEEARRAYGDYIPSSDPKRRFLVTKEPVGVVAAITPWNFPNAMITRKVAPALAAGCTVVLKPAEDTPLSALALAELADRAGFPPGVFNVVTASHGAEVGEELATHAAVRKVSFTGSTAVGKRLMALAAGNVKKPSLELGGNAPFIVFDDADLEAAVAGAVTSKFRNSGQTCICANRILVQEGVYDRFAEMFVAAVRALKVGDGRTEGVTQGPLINEKALRKVKRIVDDAIAQGARVLTGGKPHALGRTYFEPTVMVDATPAMACFDEEIFGPVAALYRFRDESEALELANRTPYGLASYVYTQDYRRIQLVSEALEYGMVGVNVPLLASELAPFGGIKESGMGREGSKYGMDEYLELKYVCVGGL